MEWRSSYFCVRFTYPKGEILSDLQVALRLFKKITRTSLHSSRMPTARLLAVSPSMHCTGGVPASRGDVCSWRVPAPSRGDACSQGQSVWGGCLLLGGVCSGGSAHRGRPLCETQPSQTLFAGSKNITQQGQIHVSGGSKGGTPRTKIFLISCNFLGKSGKIRSYGESWIRPFMVF